MTDTDAQWEARLRALTRTLPPSQQRTATEYVHDLKRLDTDPQTVQPFVIAVHEDDLAIVNQLAEHVGDETARRRWLVALTDHLVAVIDAAADEAQRRYDRSDPDEVTGYEPGFADGAAFVQSAVSQLLITANDTISTRGAALARAVARGSGEGLSLGEARAMQAAANSLVEAELAYDDGEHYSPHPISIEADARAILAAARPLLDTEPDALDRDLEGCPFCDIVRGRGRAKIVHEWPDAIAFVPLNPVTPGHVLVVPRTHVMEFTQEPWVSAMVMRRAAELAVTLDPIAEYNLITSAGEAATQTVDHLHLHLVPRREGDGLALPWAPAPVEVTATKCVACGSRLGYVNYRGHVLGWGCANAEGDDRADIAPQLGRALLDLVDRCIAADDDAPLYALLEAVAADPRVVDDTGPALVSIAESLLPMAPKMLRRTEGAS